VTIRQEPVLFNGTVYQNVVNGLLGTEHADLPAEEQMKLVEDACKAAYADEFINELPEVGIYPNQRGHHS
jgi:ATP-binding cassette, subfamily B (MDR/TAP), member 1